MKQAKQFAVVAAIAVGLFWGSSSADWYSPSHEEKPLALGGRLRVMAYEWHHPLTKERFVVFVSQSGVACAPMSRSAPEDTDNAGHQP